MIIANSLESAAIMGFLHSTLDGPKRWIKIAMKITVKFDCNETQNRETVKFRNSN